MSEASDGRFDALSAGPAALGGHPCTRPAPVLREREAPAPAPRAALGPLRPAAEAVEALTDAPFEIAMQSVLAVASLAVQGHVDVETLAGRRPTSLFCLTVAASGERKSACDGLATRVVHEVERSRIGDHALLQQRYETRLEAYRAKRRKLVRESLGEVIDAEADLEALGPEPFPPINPVTLVPDPTYEGVLRHMETGPGAIGIFSDEGGQLVGGHALSADNKLKTAAGLSKLWDGAAVNRTRASGPSSTLYGRRVALHLMVQPGVAEALLADATIRDQGLLSRCLLAWPESRIGTRLIKAGPARAASDAAARARLASFDDRLRYLLETPPPATSARPNELSPRPLPLSQEAHHALVSFANAVERRQAVDGDLAQITGVASKAAEQAARIAGVLTAFPDAEADAVTSDAMADAIALTAWYLDEARRLLDAGPVTELTLQAETLRRWLVDKWTSPRIERRDIMRRGPNRLRDGELVCRLVKILERSGWLIRSDPAEDGRRGRRAESWVVVRS